MNSVRLLIALAAVGLTASAALVGSTMAYADVLQPYNFTGMLTSGLAGDTSVTGSFTLDFTNQTVPTFDITAPGDVFNSAVPPSFGVLTPFTGFPAGNFIATDFTSAAGSPLELVFETSPPSRVLDFVTGFVPTGPSTGTQSTYICATPTCSGIPDFFFASGSATLATVPEPATWLLLSSALLGFGVVRRRNRHA
jgi:hypothetical protein